jgi:hypothetical protein
MKVWNSIQNQVTILCSLQFIYTMTHVYTNLFT